MPPQNITIEVSKIIGINYIHGDTANQLRNCWNARFSADTGFWIEANENTTAIEIATQARNLVREQQIQGIASCVLAVFIDLNQPLQESWHQELMRIPGRLQAALQCSINLLVQFGYLGDIALAADTDLLRKQTSLMGSWNARQNQLLHPFCLVGEPMLSSVPAWMPACIYLDVLRRVQQPHDLLPQLQAGNVGFLRYGECHYSRLEAIQNQLADLKRRLGQEGGKELLAELNDSVSALAKSIERDFKPTGGCQPWRPDLEITNPGFAHHNIKAATRGNYAPYTAAWSKTTEALYETGHQMEEMIVQQFVDAADQISRKESEFIDYLLRYIGIELACSEQLGTFLSPADNMRAMPGRLDYGYHPEGIAAKAQIYLDRVLEYAIGRGKKEFGLRLVKAHKGLNSQSFDSRRAALEKEQQEVLRRRRGLLSREELCDTFKLDGAHMVKCHNPIRPGGGTVKILLNEGPTADAAIDQLVGNAGYQKFFIRNDEWDGADLKCLHAVFFPLDDDRIQELIP